LKPPIISTLASAELYCLALANMYSDPNYNNLNHWNILQTLIRKGIQVPDPPDCTLTETVLIQTNPLKMVIFRFVRPFISIVAFYDFFLERSYVCHGSCDVAVWTGGGNTRKGQRRYSALGRKALAQY
jgi:hypothetical protein